MFSLMNPYRTILVTLCFLANLTPVSAQMSLPDIPYMAFYDHQSTYAATVGIGTPPGEILSIVSPTQASRSNSPRYAKVDLESGILKFRTSSEITNQIKAQVIEIFVKQAPQYRVELESEFGRADVVGEFRRMIANYGYDPNNLAHNMAAFLILQWELVTGGQADVAQMRGAANQLSGNLLSNGFLDGMDDADKQRIADMIAYQAVMSVVLAQDFERRADHSSLEKLRDGIRRSTRELGWDFDLFSLTADGFTPL